MKEHKYKPSEIEPKWSKIWEEKKIYQPDLKQAKRPFYNLMMFPYPSAEGLHVGNMYAFTGADIYGRFKRMQGFDVFEPMGLDGFGIHSENYALQIGRHPVKQAKISQENFYRQLRLIGNGFAWENKLETYDPDYYKWTQWLFVQLYKNDLAYRKKASVNWCPSCKTVLSDEQVEGGVCERCKTAAETKELEQWFFNITKYADRLLNNLDKIDWTPRVLEMQRNWIGKSVGVEEFWQVEGMDLKLVTFTTWPHTTWGATFMVIAPEHPIIEKLVKGTKYEKGARAFCKKAIQSKIKDPLNMEKNKEGYFLGRYVINHLNNRKIPLYIANFAIYEYGTGIVKCTPTHDQRDFEFAKKYNLDFVPVIYPENGQPLDPQKMEEAYTGEGLMMNAGQFNDMPTEEARKAIGDFTVKQGNGRWTTNYKLRDWCISRQRYWGPPIPMINCDHCGWVPVPEEDLPVELPYTEDWKPLGTGESPLAAVEDWVKVACPECGKPARRETDVSDTFLDSAWYFLRYPSVNAENSKFEIRNPKQILNSNDPFDNTQGHPEQSRMGDQNSKRLEIRNLKLEIPWNRQITRAWLPVDMYIGGAEHSVLHLLYSRFITMVLQDLKLLDFEEPYKKFRAHGLLISEGAKMSKSRGNVINPDEYIKRYGADTLRMYLMFIGPFKQGGDFQDKGVRGIVRFLNKVWKLLHKDKASKETSAALLKKLHQTIKKVGEDIQELKYNTAIAALMEVVNVWEQSNMSRDDAESFIKLLAPFAPYITEELWQQICVDQRFDQRLSAFHSVHQQPWPEYDRDLIKEKDVVIPVQINGKFRDQITLSSDKATNEETVKAAALKSDKTQKYTKGKEIKRVVFIKGRLINFVLE